MAKFGGIYLHICDVTYFLFILYIYIYFFFDQFPEWFIAFSFFAREFVNGIMAISPSNSDNGVTQRQRNAGFWKRRFEGTLQCIGGGDRAGRGSWRHGPNPEADFGPTRENKKHKLQNAETERCETEFGISSSNKIQKQN